jgi:integrase
MPRRRTSPLPRGITARKRKSGTVYLLSYADRSGRVHQELGGPDLREAIRLLAQRRTEIREGTFAPAGGATGRLTLDAWAEMQHAERERRGVRSIRVEIQKYRDHISPTLGSKAIADIRPSDVADLIERLKRAGTLSAKTIVNVHGVLHSMLEQARFRELVSTNVASLPRGMLPRIGKRKGPRFEREELWQLLTDPRIEQHRRVWYALQALSGMRCGEASGRRWRDLDRDTPTLSAMRVWSQYEDQPLKTARDDDTHERLVPVHPALASMLDTWRRHGFAELYGRHPSADDWLVPDPRTGRPRTYAQGQNALRRDCDRIGIPQRGVHAFRHAFVSLARSDGARKDVLETVTHNARGEMIDGYTAFEWTARCEAVSCLRFELHRATITALPKAAGADDAGPQLDASLDAQRSEPAFVHGGGGNRTLVRKHSAQLASTCVFRVLDRRERRPRKGFPRSYRLYFLVFNPSRAIEDQPAQ